MSDVIIKVDEAEELDIKMDATSSGGTSDVTKSYVDRGDASTLTSAKAYTDEISDQIPTTVQTYVEGHKAELKGDKGDKGDSIKGDKGEDGTSPTATVTKVGKTSTLTVTDVNGTTSVQILDGQDGQGGTGSAYDDTEVRSMIKANKDAIETKADSSSVPTKLSQLTNDEGFLTEHQDISGLATKTELNNKVDKEVGKGLFTGSYEDLTNKPTIPSAYDDTDIRGLINKNKDDIDRLKTSVSLSFENIGNEILDKANSSDVYLKTETYSKTEIDAQLGDVESALASIIGG